MQDLTYRLPQERTLTSAPADGENAHLNARREESVVQKFNHPHEFMGELEQDLESSISAQRN